MESAVVAADVAGVVVSGTWRCAERARGRRWGRARQAAARGRGGAGVDTTKTQVAAGYIASIPHFMSSTVFVALLLMLDIFSH